MKSVKKIFLQSRPDFRADYTRITRGKIPKINIFGHFSLRKHLKRSYNKILESKKMIHLFTFGSSVPFVEMKQSWIVELSEIPSLQFDLLVEKHDMKYPN